MLKLNQLLQVLKTSVENDDLVEFGRVIEALHSCPEVERDAFIQLVNTLTEVYPFFSWQDDIAETELRPGWMLLDQLPTKHIAFPGLVRYN